MDTTPRSYRFAWLGASGLLILAAVATWVWAARPTGDEDTARVTIALVFDTPAWGVPGELLVRSERKDVTSLLIKNSERSSLYHFDPDTHSLSLARPDEWAQAGDSAADCGSWLAQSPDGFHADPEAGLSFGDRPVATEGETIVALVAAPSGDKLAVISAEGAPGGSPLPFLSGGGATGRHYAQILAMPELTPLISPVLLPIGGKGETISPCWSPDERFLVVVNFAFTRLSLVAIEADTE